MLIHELFAKDITRTIPPVIYFGEQNPDVVKLEVGEYIITGGNDKSLDAHRETPDGIHEQYVRLLTGIMEELDSTNGPSLPAAWISGYFGSGKSSFAKLLGLALDGMTLPDGRQLSDALLAQDTSDRAHEFHEAWQQLTDRMPDRVAVIFDLGGHARAGEHVHAACLRQVQAKLGYCLHPSVARYELKLERDGLWDDFLATAEARGMPWEQTKNSALVEDAFSELLHHFLPDRYTEPLSWIDSRMADQADESPEEAARAMADMLSFRRPGATLFLVVDEVSQFVNKSSDLCDRVRAFVSALGKTLRGRGWFLALGQQKLDETAGEDVMIWNRDRFPARLQIHLSPTNIRQVVHSRLLRKKPEHEARLRKLLSQHSADLRLYAFDCEAEDTERMVSAYPLLPGHIDLLLRLTSAIRLRSDRAQGDNQAIRGLMQVLGDLFREQKFGERPVGELVTLDRIYNLLQSGLDSATQECMSRVLGFTANKDELLGQVARVVALLQIIQDDLPTTDALVAQCLYDRVDRGNRQDAIRDALEALRAAGLLTFSDRNGYALQSTAGEEWERERQSAGTTSADQHAIISEVLGHCMQRVSRPHLQRQVFAWRALFSDGRSLQDERLLTSKEGAAVTVDFRLVAAEDDLAQTEWKQRSQQADLANRLIWISGDIEELLEQARQLVRSRYMVNKYASRRESLSNAQRQLLNNEEVRIADRESSIAKAAELSWMSGQLYFRGVQYRATDFGAAFADTLVAVAERIMPLLFEHFEPYSLSATDVARLLEVEITAPAPVLLTEQLGILTNNNGRFEPTCDGVIPTRVLEFLKAESGATGDLLLSHFGGPPYAYSVEVIQACVLGLLRNSSIRLTNAELGAAGAARSAGAAAAGSVRAVRDAGAREIFERLSTFRRTQVLLATSTQAGPRDRNKICALFQKHFNIEVERDVNVIADEVERQFRPLAGRLRSQFALFRQCGLADVPPELAALERALEQCLCNTRDTVETVQAVLSCHDVLIDGIGSLQRHERCLTEESARRLHDLQQLQQHHLPQLQQCALLTGPAAQAAEQIAQQLSLPEPWNDVAQCSGAAGIISTVYQQQRQSLLERQTRHVESAVKELHAARPDLAQLPAPQQQQVLQPVHSAALVTDATSVAPPLRDLQDTVTGRLPAALQQANQRLDEILSQSTNREIMSLDLRLSGQLITTPDDIQRLLREIERRLTEHLQQGREVRLQ
ncbi:MAG: BREX system P-loop protein BrxC [Planctomycetaceae bacterium]|nr:BREX system P-loop protein BrxC [Planctomycetaceae bacterium]